MSRIIKTQNGYRMREKALSLIGKAIYDSNNAITDADKLDIASFIALSLIEVMDSVRGTSMAWEKRDYWVKADQFQAEWMWVEKAKSVLVEAIVAKDYPKIGEVYHELKKNRKILEGMIKTRKKIDYTGSYHRLKTKYLGS
ncbi:MAG: hypothetical protein Kow0088_08310 [Anaerolineales bacterium]